MVSPTSRRFLNVWMNGELVGAWHPARTSVSEFQYTNSWLESPRVRALSLSLPILPGNAGHRGNHVDAWFDNLLPDSTPIRERIQKRFKTRTTQAFELLAAIGRDCVGAVQILAADDEPGNVRRIEAEELNPAAVARVLRATTSSKFFGDEDNEEFRISIAGAQEKTALLRLGDRWYAPRGATPTTHILKLPLGLIGNLKANMEDSVENEWLCLEFLSQLGLPTARTEIARFEDEVGEIKALVVERFDRAFESGHSSAQSWILRLPQEDMCQATGTPPESKYESDGGPGIPQILSLLQAGAEPNLDALLFSKTQLAFWLLAAPDGHAKNFSIFLKRNGYSMTPLYDVLSAWPIIGNGPTEWAYQKAKLAMAIRGSKPYRHFRKVAVRHWEKLAAETGVPTAFDDMVEMVANCQNALEELEQRIPENFPPLLWERLRSGVLSHRERFLTGLTRSTAA
jgi:serine/threonine-protein kinase HipA